jgi:hypothetical protein
MLLKEASRTKNNQELVKASIDALVTALEAGHSDALSAYLTAMSQFHHYSFQNILLIASQRPTASRVAGIRSWNELGRRVKRGEKGIMIFSPMVGYKRNASETDQNQQSDARTDKPEPLCLAKIVICRDFNSFHKNECSRCCYKACHASALTGSPSALVSLST